MPGIIDVVDVTKRFGALLVIDGLSVSLAEGEALGIVGPNGAGKTTLLSLIAGDIAPSTGEIHFDGERVTALRAHRRSRLGIARTSQIPRPFDGLTVFENALVGASHSGRGHGIKPNDACIAALERTNMLDRCNRRAGDLTLLERKRLELARALATSPRVLLLDELAGGLTEAEVDELVEMVRAIHREGMSIVWIEHVVHALVRTVERIITVDSGRILIEGDPETVMASPEVRAIYLGEDVD